MTVFQKVTNILMAIILVALSVILIALPSYGYLIILIVLSVTFLFNGIKTLWYYITMARHMVGGWRSLFRGILVFDIGLFTMSLSSIPSIYIVLYLAGIYIFTGGISVVNALNAKKMESTHYKPKLIAGIINVLIGISCIVLMKWGDYVVYVYAFGMVYNAILRVINVFHKEEMVYIQ